MAEDQGGKEDKFDFDSAGEAVGYISLDQARLLAMQTARDDPGDYGASFQGTPMVYDVVEEEETEDHYVVSLSFRPAGDFRGRPGLEQFFVDGGGTAHDQRVGVRQLGVQALFVPVLTETDVETLVGRQGLESGCGDLVRSNDEELVSHLLVTVH